MTSNNGQTRIFSGLRGNMLTTSPDDVSASNDAKKGHRRRTSDGSAISEMSMSVASVARSSYPGRRSSSVSDEITVYYDTPGEQSSSSTLGGDDSILRSSFTISIPDEQGRRRSSRKSLSKKSRSGNESVSSRDALDDEEKPSLDFETLKALQRASELSFRLNQDGIELVPALPSPPKKKSLLTRMLAPPRPPQKTYNKTIVSNKKRGSKKSTRRYLDAADDFHMPANYY